MQEINYAKANRIFNEYVNKYDINDGMTKLKIIHTFHVVDIAKTIAKDLKLSKEDIILAQIIALLHDIGRFEQIRRYHTFYDSKSVNHALLGVEILKENNFLDQFVQDEVDQQIVLKAIENHNRFKIEDNLNERTLLHCKIVRDADKTDIFRVRVEDPIEDVVGFSMEEMNNSKISKDVYNDFFDDKVILSKHKKTPLDGWVSATAFIFDYNFMTGLEMIQKENRIDETINRIHPYDIKTKEELDRIRIYANEYINKQIAKLKTNS